MRETSTSPRDRDGYHNSGKYHDRDRDKDGNSVLDRHRDDDSAFNSVAPRRFGRDKDRDNESSDLDRVSPVKRKGYDPDESESDGKDGYVPDYPGMNRFEDKINHISNQETCDVENDDTLVTAKWFSHFYVNREVHPKRWNIFCFWIIKSAKMAIFLGIQEVI